MAPSGSGRKYCRKNRLAIGCGSGSGGRSCRYIFPHFYHFFASYWLFVGLFGVFFLGGLCLVVFPCLENMYWREMTMRARTHQYFHQFLLIQSMRQHQPRGQRKYELEGDVGETEAGIQGGKGLRRGMI